MLGVCLGPLDIGLGQMRIELNGAHPFADGKLHHHVADHRSPITHAGAMWNYAAGIAHPFAHFHDHGLSLIPYIRDRSPSPLWGEGVARGSCDLKILDKNQFKRIQMKRELL